MSINSPSLSRKQRIGYSEAEERFREFVKENKPDLRATKKGLPDFMIIKEGKIVGFVEVKRDWPDNLIEEQKLFKEFCRERGIPYQVWRPIMTRKIWKGFTHSKFIPQATRDRAHAWFKRGMAGGEEIWDKI